MDHAGNISLPCWDITYLDMTRPETEIISPPDNSFITARDSLPIFGKASDERFVDYWLRYRPTGTEDWLAVNPDSHSTIPVDSGLLGYWNAGSFAGYYDLSLTTADSAQNSNADTITICFISPVETPPVIDAEFATFSSFPTDVATDALDFVYITDTGDDKIWKFSETGDSLLVFGHHGTGNDSTGFNQPKGVAVDDSGFIWVTDCLNHCVKKFDGQGNFKFKFGQHGHAHGEFNEPCGIAFDETGYLWVCDNKNDRVQKFDRRGNFILQAPDNGERLNDDNGNAGSYDGVSLSPNDGIIIPRHVDDGFEDRTGIKSDTIELQKITGISIQGASVYVTDSKHDRIVVFDTAGRYVKIIGRSAGLKKPWDNQIDYEGNLLVADVYNNRIVEFNQWGCPILVFGVQGDSAGQFKQPHGLALSSGGKYLYVCDTDNNRVQKFLLRFDPQLRNEGGVMAYGDKALRLSTLCQNHPNPFVKTTTIKYHIGLGVKAIQEKLVSLKIYDITGRLVRTLVSNHQQAGDYVTTWNGIDDNGREISSGIYFCALKSGDYSKTVKMVLLR
jgi:DNA-binding beta-propeller fold protein YncE